MKSRTLLALLVVAPAFSGCVSVSAGDGLYDLAPTAAPVVSEADAIALANQVDAPIAWQVGNYWRFDVQSAQSGRFSHGLVVYKEDGAAYHLATDDRDYAIRQAIIDPGLLLGAISKRDLRVLSGAHRTDLFDFPLVNNKTWNVPGFRGSYAATATFNPSIPTPVGPSPGFEVEGTAGNGFLIRFSYVPAVKWFTYLEYRAPDGSTMFKRTLVEYKERFDGQYILLDTALLYAKSRAGTDTGAPAETLNVQNRDALLIHAMASGAGAANVKLLRPNNEEAWSLQTSGTDIRAESFAEVVATPGVWNLAYGMAGNATVHVMIVGLNEQRGRIV